MGVILPSLRDESGAAPRPAFATLYRHQFHLVWSLTAHFGVAPSAREDVAQEVWLTVHRRLDSLRADASPRAWVASITRRIASRHHRAQRRLERKLAALEQIDREAQRGAFVPDAFAQADAVLTRMDPGQREVFLLMQVEEMSGPEVAQILDVPLNTVYSRLRLARARLAEALAEHGRDEGELVAHMREPVPTRRVSMRVWWGLTAELGIRSTAVLAGGIGSKLAGVVATATIVVALPPMVDRSEPAPVVAIDDTPPSKSDAPDDAPAIASPPMVAAAVLTTTHATEVTPVPTHATTSGTREPTPRSRTTPRARPDDDAAAKPPPSAPAPTDTEALAAEAKLITAAQQALRDGDPARAQRALAEHGQRFPDGKLAVDRRAARVRALCAAGDAVNARAEADRLLAEHPDVSSAVAVRDVCR